MKAITLTALTNIPVLLGVGTAYYINTRFIDLTSKQAFYLSLFTFISMVVIEIIAKKILTKTN